MSHALLQNNEVITNVIQRKLITKLGKLLKISRFYHENSFGVSKTFKISVTLAAYKNIGIPFLRVINQEV